MTAVPASREDTFPKLLRRNAHVRGGRPAIRHKDLGIWQTWTWAQVTTKCAPFAVGAAQARPQRGDTVAIVGDNRPAALLALMAAQTLGAIPVPVYADAVADEMAYVLEHAEVKFAIVENQEQVDKLMSIADRLPKLARIVYDEQRGLRDYDHARLHPLDEHDRATARERARHRTRARKALDEAIAAGKGSDVASCSTPPAPPAAPRASMLTHDNVVDRRGRNGNAFDHLDRDETMLAYLPMAWVGDHIFSYGQALAAGFCVACPEAPRPPSKTAARSAPTYFFAPPRVFENLLTQIMVRMEDASRAQAPDVPLLPGGGQALRREDPRRRARAARRPAALRARRSAGLWRRSRTAGLFAPARRPTPRARRSGPSCSRSTARSAST